ncbi:MAG: alpha/beta hydrolase [Lachnospiraceae bacterium]|nr:alpha/beta hydrolase [Lachnospiraceae bacterium]
MKVYNVDLYEHFGFPKPKTAEGILECYLPETPPEMKTRRQRPAMLVLPGGGYFFTSGREAEVIALRFVAKGYAGFVLRYSCSPLRFPTALREAAMAMRYIRENADQMEVRADKVAALGFSAGGHLCGTLGTLFDAPEVADIALAEVVRPDGLCLCYPVTVARGKTHEGSFQFLCGKDEELRDRLSMDALVRPDMPPVFLWHTRDDNGVPVKGTLQLALALEDAEVDFALHIFRHGQHGLSAADATVYRAFEVPESSEDLASWPEMALNFFAEKGFVIQDEAI